VLAEADAGAGLAGEALPAVVSMPYDRGVVTAVLAEGLWRWDMLSGDRAAGLGAYERFWSNTVRWMALGGAFRPGQSAALRLSQRSVRTGESVEIEAIRRTIEPGRALTVAVIGEDGAAEPVPLRAVGGGGLRLRGQWVASEAGVVRVVATLGDEPAAEAMLSVYEADRERMETADR
ncbi:MAG: hypothetical protein AAF078_14880, partial [Planctomycetota bacterium]